MTWHIICMYMGYVSLLFEEREMKKRNKNLSQALVLSLLVSSGAFAQEPKKPRKIANFFRDKFEQVFKPEVVKPEVEEEVITSNLNETEVIETEVTGTEVTGTEEAIKTPNQKKVTITECPEVASSSSSQLTSEDFMAQAEELKTELDNKNTEIDELKQKISEMEDNSEEIEALKVTVQVREEEISQLVSEIETLLAKVAENEELKEELKKLVASLESELQSAKDLLAEKEKALEEKEEIIAEKEEKEKELEEKNKELEVANCEKEDMLEKMALQFQQQQQMMTQQMTMMNMMMMQMNFMSNFNMRPSVTDNYQHLYPFMMMSAMNSMNMSNNVGMIAMMGIANGLGQQNSSLYVGGNMYGGDYSAISNPAANANAFRINNKPMLGSTAVPYAHNFSADADRSSNIEKGETIDVGDADLEDLGV